MREGKAGPWACSSVSCREGDLVLGPKLALSYAQPAKGGEKEKEADTQQESLAIWLTPCLSACST